MEGKEDKEWASKYLLDPLTAPEPSQETGPGTHYGSTFEPMKSQTASIVDPDAESQKSAKSSVRGLSTKSKNPYHLPRHSATREDFPGFDQSISASSPRASQDSTQIPTSTSGYSTAGHGRQSSLSSRNGDGLPGGALAMAKRNSLRAQRAPHLRKGAIPGPDRIDILGNVGFGPYHHGGPYDATLQSRNKRSYSSPVKATEHTNRAALRATPAEQVQDSLHKHRPLDGVASIPPGTKDSSGRRYNYEESNMMTANGGNYKRWADLQYHPDDIKGKSEPAYSIERSLKEHKPKRHTQTDDQGIEMASPRRQGLRRERPRPRSSDSNAPPREGQSYADWERDRRDDGQHGGLRRRFGSLRM